MTPHAHRSVTTPSSTRGRRTSAGPAELIHARDPGLDRLRLGLQMMMGIGVTLGVMYAFMQCTHILWAHAPAGLSIARGELTALDAQHHEETLLAMLIGGVLATLTTLGVSEPSPRSQALTVAFMPIPLLAAMALAIELVPHHAFGVAGLAVMLGLSVYARKFVPRLGPRAANYGLELFVGYLFGFLTNGAIRERQLGWFAIFTCVALLVNLFLKVAIYRPIQRHRLTWSLRSFASQGDALLTTSSRLLSERPGPRTAERLHRQIGRLNATALVIDASLSAPSPGLSIPSPQAMHSQLFRTERVVHTVALDVERLAACDLTDAARVELTRWLIDLRAGRSDRPANALRCLASGVRIEPLRGLSDVAVETTSQLARSIVEAQQVREAWPAVTEQVLDATTEPYVSAVILIGGSLPGSALVGARTATPGTDRIGRLLTRARLDGVTLSAIRIAVAAGSAAALGSILSEQRYYWAVLAVFVTFLGSNTSGEQVTKAGWRIVGTIVGILLGGVLAHAVGYSTWSIAVIIVAFGVGTMLMQLNYAFFVIGLTIALSQLYGQIGVYSNHLLVVRLEENGIGVAIAALAAVSIFPVRTRRALRIAADDYLAALARLVDRVGEHAAGRGDVTSLTAAVRGLDAAHHQLTATAKPLALNPGRRADTQASLQLLARTSHRARDIVNSIADDTTDDRGRPPFVHDQLDELRDGARRIDAALAAGSRPIGWAASGVRSRWTRGRRPTAA